MVCKLSRNLIVTIGSIAIVLTNFSSSAAQFSGAKLEAIKAVLKPLEMTRADVEKVLAQGTLTSWNRGDGFQTFYRDDETIDVRYSTGTCDFDGYEFMPFDAWNVPKDTLVAFSVEPKDKVLPESVGINLSSLRKERLFRSHKNHLAFFDKRLGFAVYLWGDTIDTVHFFPSSNLIDQQCKSARLQNYFRSGKWRFTPQPKHQAVDFNFPASVKSLEVKEEGPRTFAVEATPEDPENDVVTFNYYVSAGRVVGRGGKITWDLSDATPGTYTLTAAVDDGAGLRGKFLRKTVILK